MQNTRYTYLNGKKGVLTHNDRTPSILITHLSPGLLMELGDKGYLRDDALKDYEDAKKKERDSR